MPVAESDIYIEEPQSASFLTSLGFVKTSISCFTILRVSWLSLFDVNGNEDFLQSWASQGHRYIRGAH